jgi:hypothetical protein
VKTNKRTLSRVLMVAIVMTSVVVPRRPFAQSTEAKSSSATNSSSLGRWSVLVDKVDPGDINLAPSFQIAIYEGLLDELSTAKKFKQVLRDGDRNASEIPNLLTLKTTVQKYAAGSETRRAVTTVSGATKLTVRSQLLTRDGKIVLERTFDGNVRFMGSNLRATHNLARNVANAIKQSSLPQPSFSPLSRANNSAPSDDIVVVEFR